LYQLTEVTATRIAQSDKEQKLHWILTDVLGGLSPALIVINIAAFCIQVNMVIKYCRQKEGKNNVT
jgi:type IV secretory pathway VirB2 component (pilin)